MDWKIKFIKISPKWWIELMQLYSKLKRALERTWQDASVIYIETGQEEKNSWIPNATDNIVLFLPQWCLFLNFLSFPTSSWSYVRMPQGSGLQLLSTITLTPLVISPSLVTLNKNHLLASMSISLSNSLLYPIVYLISLLGYLIDMWNLTKWMT